FSTKERVFWAVKFVLFWLFVSALWGLKQEYIGMSDAEMKWLMSDKERFQLMFQWTRFRIFSMFSDATTFGIMMAYTCVWCIIIIAGPAKTFSKILAGIAFLSMLLTSAYSGTRTAYVLIPAGFLMWTMLAMNRNMLLIIGFFMLIGTAAMMKSTSNALIYRIQSAFKPTKDNSVLVRIKNQKFIQPYIQSHPIGFGLGSCGIWGKRFTPDSWLANFPHDSGYVRMAVELGWVGLILNLIFLFVIMRTGIYYYFRVRDPMIKNIYLGLCVCIFCMILANYPQEAIIQLPNSIVFYTMLAVLTRLKDFDTPITDGTIIEVKNNQDNYKRGQ
ncbi:MAG: O-antigen ligase family protein, partial [Saprospiraceae bacterium]